MRVRRACFSFVRFFSSKTDPFRPLVPAPKTIGATRSSVLPGEKLGIIYVRHKAEPVALEDHEYPSWLWTIQEDMKKEEEAAKRLNEMSQQGDGRSNDRNNGRYENRNNQHDGRHDRRSDGRNDGWQQKKRSKPRSSKRWY